MQAAAFDDGSRHKNKQVFGEKNCRCFIQTKDVWDVQNGVTGEEFFIRTWDVNFVNF